MKHATRKVIGPLLGTALLAAPSLAVAEVRPHLWRCSGTVHLNAKVLKCEEVSKQGLQLKSGDVVAVVDGLALTTGWDGEIWEIKGKNKAMEVGPPPRRETTLFNHVLKALESLFTVNRQAGLLKGPSSADPTIALLQPGDVNVTSWRGPVRWQLPTGYGLLLRVRAPGKKGFTVVRLLQEPGVDLASLRLGSATEATLELLLLDSRPTVAPSYGDLPTEALLSLAGRPVRGVLTTSLRRKAASDLAKEDQAIADEIGSLSALRQAAVLASHGRLMLARTILNQTLPDGVPEPWLQSLSGVTVQAIP